MHRRIASVTAVLTALVMLVGCSSSGGGTTPSPSSTVIPVKGEASGTLPANSTPAPSPSSSSPTSSSPAPTPTTRASTPAPGLRDFTSAAFTVPSGFTQVNDYSPQTALETDYSSYYLVPSGVAEGKDVIGIYVYTLPSAKTVTASTDQVALIKAYNTKVKGTAPSINMAVSDIDGLSAYTENVTEPPDYHYVAYWAFGTHHFLQFTCQLGSTSTVANLALGCGQALATLQLN